MKYRIIVLIAIFSVFLNSCDTIFIFVPPSGYTLNMVTSEITESFDISEINYVKNFFEVEIGDGITFEATDPNNSIVNVYIFKFEYKNIAKERWNTLIQNYGKWTKKNYLNLTLLNQGYLRISIKDNLMVSWWKDEWIVIVYGETAESVSKELLRFFKLLKPVYSA